MVMGFRNSSHFGLFTKGFHKIMQKGMKLYDWDALNQNL